MRNRSTKPNKQKVYQEPKKVKAIADMSEEEKISLGYRNPYVQKFDFTKTPEEREKLKKLHSNAKMPSGGSFRPTRRTEPELQLIVHIAPRTGEDYKSTHAFKAKESEVGRILHTFFEKESITKVTFAGKEVA